METSTTSPPPSDPAGERSPSSVTYQTLNHWLRPLRGALDQDITELCINAPGEFWTEGRGGWMRHVDPTLTYEHLSQLARLIANASSQRLDATHPLLSGTLPSGERIQIVIPPATTTGHVSITLRKPNAIRFTLSDYEGMGFFKDARVTTPGLLPVERELKDLLAARNFASFLQLAVTSRQTILVSGGTGSGKTTFTKALIDLVPPEERLITIEDSSELEIRAQPNHVRLYYTKGGQGLSKVTSRDLMEACLRMKPDRILPAEVRDASAFQFLQAAQSGHPGSMTTVHANSEVEALGRMAMLVGAAEEAQGMSRDDVRQLVMQSIDVVVQVGKVAGSWSLTGIYYEPERKLAALG